VPPLIAVSEMEHSPQCQLTVRLASRAAFVGTNFGNPFEASRIGVFNLDVSRRVNAHEEPVPPRTVKAEIRLTLRFLSQSPVEC
jgi:hypothetical protein